MAKNKEKLASFEDIKRNPSLRDLGFGSGKTPSLMIDPFEKASNNMERILKAKKDYFNRRTDQQIDRYTEFDL